MDPDRPIRRLPTRSDGSARNPSTGNSRCGNLTRHDRSSTVQFKALALPPCRSPDMRSGIRFYNDATNKRGIGPFRLWRLQLADSPTILHQRSSDCSGRILSSNHSRIPHDNLDPRTSRNSDHSTVCRRPVLLAAQFPQNTILIVCRELQELAKTCHQ